MLEVLDPASQQESAGRKMKEGSEFLHFLVPWFEKWLLGTLWQLETPSEQTE